MSENYLEIKNLQASLYTKHRKAPIVDGISITIPKGKIIGIVGESGCGKSITAKSIIGLVHDPVRVDGGEILFEGKNLLTISKKELRKIRGSAISMIFQEPMTSLNPVVTIGKQVEEIIRLHEKCSHKDAKERVLELLMQVGIADAEHRYHAYPHQLSGGLRQRVMIAMAMACDPEILLADEPTTALDVTMEAQILKLMRKLRDERQLSILLITHNMGVVAEMCDYVYVMYAGNVVEAATVYDIFEDTRHPYTKGLLASIPQIDKDVKRLAWIPGTVPDVRDRNEGCPFYNRCQWAKETCKKAKPLLEKVSENHLVRCYRESEIRAEERGDKYEG